MTIQQVIDRWLESKPAKSHLSPAVGIPSISTDGELLFSYDLEIGYTEEDGTKVVRTKRLRLFSRTTDRHIRTALYRGAKDEKEV